MLVMWRVKWGLVTDAAWMMGLQNWWWVMSKHMFCTTIFTNTFTNTFANTFANTFLNTFANTNIFWNIFTNLYHTFWRSIVLHLKKWKQIRKRKIAQDGIERKITLLVIVIDNFPPLKQGSHNFGGYRRFITAPLK